MPLTVVENRNQVAPDPDGIAIYATDVPAHQASWVRSRTFVSSENRYVVFIDRGVISGARKGGLNAQEHLRRAGYVDAELPADEEPAE